MWPVLCVVGGSDAASFSQRTVLSKGCRRGLKTCRLCSCSGSGSGVVIITVVGWIGMVFVGGM